MPQAFVMTRPDSGRPSPDEVAEMFRDAFTVIRRRQRSILERSDLSLSEWSALHLCVQGGARAREIADAVGLTPAAVTDIIDRLQRRRLVHRTRDPRDRRAIRIELTETGRRLHREASRQMMRFFSATVERLAPKEYEALATGLRALVRVEDTPHAHTGPG
ncbi:MAG TPA: MarR family transcriptional regulator [Thermoplasmata archaeon]|nr:MarR family transcriptional regulator [Thermoplasmata archaeon]